MERVPEPDLMNDPEQAEAYHRADFNQAHGRFIELFQQSFATGTWDGPVLDLGCGTADITRRFAEAYPDVIVHGIDGAENMLRWGREVVGVPGLSGRVRLFCRHLPTTDWPELRYGAVISNSLLHHLKNPLSLWSAIRQVAAPGAPIFVMDLLRPDTPERAAELVACYASGEPDVLRRDFFNSLLAAYRPREVELQFRAAGWDTLTLEVVSDRHWIVRGRA